MTLVESMATREVAMTMKTVSFDVDQEDFDRVSRAAARQGMTAEEWAAETFRNLVPRITPPAPPTHAFTREETMEFCKRMWAKIPKDSPINHWTREDLIEELSTRD